MTSTTQQLRARLGMSATMQMLETLVRRWLRKQSRTANRNRKVEE